MATDPNGPLDDPASYAGNLADPEAVRVLLRAALHAFLTLRHGRLTVNPEEIGTHLDLKRIERELHAALAAVGHPAGESPPVPTRTA